MGRRSREKRERRQGAADRAPGNGSSADAGRGDVGILPYLLLAPLVLVLMADREAAVVGVVPGTLLVADRGLAFLRAWLARDWRRTTATVLTSAVHRDPEARDGHVFWSPVVTYAYEVDGVAYTGRRISLTGHGVRNSAGGAARQALGRLGEGERVQVWYDPDDPARSALYRHLGPSSWLALGAGLALLGISVPRFVEVFSR